MSARGMAFAVVLVNAGSAFVAVWLYGRPELAAVEAATGFEIAVDGALIGMGWALVGGVLAWLRPRNLVGWLMLGVGTCQGLSAALALYGGLGVASADPDWPMARWSAWLASWLWLPGLLPLANVLPALYPEGRLPDARFRWPVVAAAVGIASLSAGAMLSEQTYQDVAPGPSPLAATFPSWVVLMWAVLTAALLLGGTLAVWVLSAARLVRAQAPERQQLAWLFVVLLLAFLPVFGPGERLFMATLYLIPVAIAMGVLRYGMLGIEFVLRRGLVYGLLTAAVLAAYVGVTAAASAGVDRGPLPGVLAASLVAVGLTPARERLQRGVDRLLYGERSDPMRAVRQLGSRVAAADQQDLLSAVLSAVTAAVRAPGAAVVGPDGHLLAAIGTPAEGDELRLTVSGQPVGLLRVAARRPGERFTDSDRRLLSALAPQVAVLVRALALAEALEAERDRVVAATRRERDRLQRDLHDGLGPSLSGVGLGLQALDAALLAQDLAAAGRLVARMRTEVQWAVGDVRRILDDLRPASLADAGLADAVRRLAASASFPVDVHSCELPPLPAEVETTAFRIASEALTNVARHADATYAHVHLQVDGAVLTLEVVDNGRGLPIPRCEHGIGIASMSHRAESCGGTLSVASSGHGTAVTATLPLVHP